MVSQNIPLKHLPLHGRVPLKDPLTIQWLPISAVLEGPYFDPLAAQEPQLELWMLGSNSSFKGIWFGKENVFWTPSSCSSEAKLWGPVNARVLVNVYSKYWLLEA